MMDLLKSAWWQLWEFIRWDVPKVMLVVLLFGFVWSIWKVQGRNDFDFADMFKDKNDKVTSSRFIGIGTWVAATWYVMQDMMDGVPTVEIFGLYIGIFSGVGVASRAIEKWKG
jgi:hypothetical protein